MNKTLIVLKHEFTQKVKSKGFIIMTLIGPLLMSLTFVIPILFANVNHGDTREFAVVDSTRVLAPLMLERSRDTASGFLEKAVKTDAKLSVASLGANTIDSLRRLVDTKALTGFLVIPANALTDSVSHASLKLRNTSDFGGNGYITSLYKNALRETKLKAHGIDPALIDHIEDGAMIETMKVDKESEEKDNGAGVILAYVTAFILYISMVMYGAIIMNTVIEEKSSRVVEIMVSSIRPYELLVGKVLGIGAAALLQVAVWGLMLAVLSTAGISAMSGVLGEKIMPSVNPALFLYFILFFALGFMIYSTLYAAIGSTAESASDVQQVSFPVTMLVVIPFILLSGVIQNPSSSSSTILSMIPFFAPILMLGRIFTETPPFWQIALSVVIMVATFFGCLWVAARIYRVGILMYGKKFSLGEIVKWIRYS